MVERPRRSADDASPTVGEPTATPVTTAQLLGVTGAALVPEWLVNLAALSWRLLAVVGLAAVACLLAGLLWTVTASVAVAVVVAALFAPLVVRLRARGWSRMKAAAVVWVASMTVATVVLVVLGLMFVPYLTEMATRIATGITALQAQLASAQVPAFVGIMVQDATAAAQSTAGGAVGGLVALAAGAVTVAILATFLVFFFLRDGDTAWVWLIQAISDQKRSRITAAGEDALDRVGGYLRGTTILSALIAGTNLVFLTVLGIPLALPLAILSFLAGYIPYFGGIVTTGIILLVTLGTKGAFTAFILIVLIGVRNAILGYGVRPAVYGRTVSIHPALVLIALPAGFQLAGIVGLFAAVPLTAVVLAVASATVAVVDPTPHPPLPGLVPAWLDRVARSAWRILVVLALLGLLIIALDTIPLVVVPLVLGVILAATFEPVVQTLLRRGQSRGRAAATAVGGGFLAIVAVLVVTVVVLAEQAQEIARTTTDGAGSLSASLGGQLDLTAQAVAQIVSGIVHALAALVSGLVTVSLVAVLSTLLAFYLLRDGPALWRRTTRHVPASVAPRVDAAGHRAAEVLAGYMFGTAAISLVGATSQLVIMVVLGLPLALPIFVLSFFLCFIPYIGGFISTGLALLIAVAVGSPLAILVMVIWTIVFNLVTGNIVSPIVYGKTVHLHPAIVLLAIPAGSAIAGILGMFLVVPLLGVIAATWRTVLALMAFRAAQSAPTADTADGLTPNSITI